MSGVSAFFVQEPDVGRLASQELADGVLDREVSGCSEVAVCLVDPFACGSRIQQGERQIDRLIRGPLNSRLHGHGPRFQ